MRNDESNESRASYAVAAREGEYRRRGRAICPASPRMILRYFIIRDARRHIHPRDRNVTVNDGPAAKSAGMSRGGAFPLINLIRLALAC